MSAKCKPLAVEDSGTNDAIHVAVADGREISAPLAWLPRLKSAPILWAMLSVLMAPDLALAAPQIMTASHTYVLGDNDSRNEARQICFIEAKRKILEKAGSFIQTQTEVADFQLSKDQIKSYSAAILSVEIVKEDYKFSNGQSSLTLTVKAEVDLADVRKRLQQIAVDKVLQKRIAEQQLQIKRLEGQIGQLNAQVKQATNTSAGNLRKERSEALDNLQQLESRKLDAVQAINEKTALVRQYIVPNMTMEEVKSILGEPRATTHNAWNYGELWVIFENGLVLCVSRSASPFGDLDCLVKMNAR